jgi:hypothetical protein
VLNKDGIKPRQKSISAIGSWQRPKSLHELQSFLGLTNYLRNFVPKYSELIVPMVKIMDHKKKRVNWNCEAEISIERAKSKFMKMENFTLYVLDKYEQLVVKTDASGVAAGPNSIHNKSSK